MSIALVNLLDGQAPAACDSCPVHYCVLVITVRCAGISYIILYWVGLFGQSVRVRGELRLRNRTMEFTLWLDGSPLAGLSGIRLGRGVTVGPSDAKLCDHQDRLTPKPSVRTNECC